MHSSLVGTPDEAHTYLKAMADAFDIRELANVVLHDWRFPLWSGSSKPFQHHYGREESQDDWRLRNKRYEGLHEGVVDEVLHAILAHHGLREWGSPVSPNTHMAWLLHLCDGISARMNDATKWDRHK